jgi:hypothetical protein
LLVEKGASLNRSGRIAQLIMFDGNITQGRPRRDAPTIAPRLLADKLKDELQCELTNPGIHGRPQATKVSIAHR